VRLDVETAVPPAVDQKQIEREFDQKMVRTRSFEHRKNPKRKFAPMENLMGANFNAGFGGGARISLHAARIWGRPSRARA
jgi:hypothetical protein